MISWIIYNKLFISQNRGGGSYASYKNVVTTAKVLTTSDKTSSTGAFGLTLQYGLQTEQETCTGMGGVGAIAIHCQVRNFFLCFEIRQCKFGANFFIFHFRTCPTQETSLKLQSKSV